MLGTLKGALDVRQVPMGEADLVADAEGVNEIRDGLPVLTRIHVRYTMRVPAAHREAVDRALARHQDKCPTAATLRGCVAVSWSADIDAR
jgi:organic hydroperoxide reductase OsmC/OhrA